MSDDDGSTMQKRPLPVRGGLMLFAAYLLSWLIIIYVSKRIYSSWYRRQTEARRNRWFGGHPEKDAYETALALPEGSGDQMIDEEKLRKLLLRRAMADFRRVLQLNQEKESLYNLMRSGAVSEDMWNNFKEAENDMQIEIFDLQAEAETFKQGIVQFSLYGYGRLE